MIRTALAAYPGAVVAVSHDRAFRDRFHGDRLELRAGRRHWPIPASWARLGRRRRGLPAARSSGTAWIGAPQSSTMRTSTAPGSCRVTISTVRRRLPGSGRGAVWGGGWLVAQIKRSPSRNRLKQRAK